MEKEHFFISGIVQGVGFRWYVQRIAKSLNLTGWVKNLPDGRVEVLVEGEKGEIESFVKKLKEGYLGRNIKEIQRFKEKGEKSYNDFSIVF